MTNIVKFRRAGEARNWRIAGKPRRIERRSPLWRVAQTCIYAILLCGAIGVLLPSWWWVRIMTAAFFVALLAASLADNHDYARGIDE